MQNISRTNLTARRLSNRQDRKMDQMFNKSRYVNNMLVERNQGGATQVRNIAGRAGGSKFATFGTPSNGNSAGA